MQQRFVILMRRLVINAAHEQDKEVATEEFLKFAQVVMQVNGGTDFFKAVNEAKTHLASYSHYHGEQVYQMVNEYFGLSQEASFGGNALSEYRVLHDMVSV